MSLTLCVWEACLAFAGDHTCGKHLECKALLLAIGDRGSMPDTLLSFSRARPIASQFSSRQHDCCACDICPRCRGYTFLLCLCIQSHLWANVVGERGREGTGRFTARPYIDFAIIKLSERLSHASFLPWPIELGPKNAKFPKPQILCIFECPRFDGHRLSFARLFDDAHGAMRILVWNQGQKAVSALISAIFTEA